MGSTIEEDSEEAGDCEERSNRSTCQGLFLNLQMVCSLMERWIVCVRIHIGDIKLLNNDKRSYLSVSICEIRRS